MTGKLGNRYCDRKETSICISYTGKAEFPFHCVEESHSPHGRSHQKSHFSYVETYRLKALTITCIYVKEFVGHQEVTNELNADVYFAHLRSSEYRGIDKNTNVLLRQNFLTNQELDTVNAPISQISQMKRYLCSKPTQQLTQKISE